MRKVAFASSNVVRGVFSRCGLLGLCFLAPGMAAFGQVAPQAATFTPADTLRAQARQLVAQLAADSLWGRGAYGDGHTKAARLVARQMAALGLAPLYPARPGPQAYWQPFNYPLHHVAGADLVLNGSPLRLGHDYLPSPSSPSIQLDTRWRLAGTGLEPDWLARYQGKLNGQCVALDTGVAPNHPRAEALRSNPYALQGLKLSLAAQAGARCVLLRTPKLTHSLASKPEGPPVYLLKAWPKQARGTLTGHIDATTTQLETQNVVGLLASTNPAKYPQPALVIAHYDHLGTLVNSRDTARFLGANDNASGTAALLLLAQELARHPERLERDVIFIAFGAEEAGLWGSIHYAGQPLLPVPGDSQPAELDLAQTHVVFNLDILGTGEDGLTVVGGEEQPNWMDRLRTTSAAQGCPTDWATRPNKPISDHYPLSQRGATPLYIYTRGGVQHYHDVGDAPGAPSLHALPCVVRTLAALLTDGQP